MSDDGAGAKAIFAERGGGRLYEQRGFRGWIKVVGDESAGRQCFSEWTVDAGEAGPPPHLHREHQEAFFVVEGTLTFRGTPPPRASTRTSRAGSRASSSRSPS